MGNRRVVEGRSHCGGIGVGAFSARNNYIMNVLVNLGVIIKDVIKKHSALFSIMETKIKMTSSHQEKFFSRNNQS